MKKVSARHKGKNFSERNKKMMENIVKKIKISPAEGEGVVFGGNWLTKKLWKIERGLLNRILRITTKQRIHDEDIDVLSGRISEQDKSVAALTEEVSALTEEVSALSGGEDATTKWEKEHQVFIDQWNRAWNTGDTFDPTLKGSSQMAFGRYGKYDLVNAPDKDRPFYGGGIWMSYKDALDVMRYGSTLCSVNNEYRFSNVYCRTLLPIDGTGVEISGAYMFYRSHLLETLFLPSTATYTNCDYMFFDCHSLQKIFGEINIVGRKSLRYMFSNCGALEYVSIFGLSADLDLHSCSGLSPFSIQYMVKYARNTSAITLTLHSSAYARVTEEIFALAAEKNITIAST